MDLIDRLLEHDYWAMTYVLEASQNLTEAQLDRPFDVGHRTLRETLDHMIFTVAFWTGLMVGEPLAKDQRGQGYDRSVPSLTERYERFARKFATVARQMRDEGRLDDTFVDHYGLPTSFGGTIIQVAMHNVEHRGEAVHILQRLGVPDPPELDHLLWEHIREGH